MPTIAKRINCKADGRLYADVSFSYSEKSTNLAKNTSTISWSVAVKQGGITFVGHNRSSAAVIKVYINGEQVLSRSIGLTDSPSSWSQSGSIDVAHNSDGTKTISASLTIEAGGGNYAGDPWTYSGASGSSSLALKRLARVSSISCAAVTIGSTATIKISRQSTSFSHVVSYKFGSQSGSFAKTTNETIAWEVPLELANEIPNATSGTCVLTCTTYSGNTVIGSKSINVKLTVASEAIPTIGSLTAVPFSEKVPKEWGVFVQSKSKAVFSVNDAKGIYGSSIKSYSIKGGGITGNASPFTTDYLTKSGKITFSATVTDSRGRTSKPATVTITVLAYQPPTFGTCSLNRCIANGTLSDEGTCVLANTTFTVAGLDGHNSATTDIQYRKSGETSWVDTKQSFTSGKNVVFGDAKISAESSYEVQLSVTDVFGTITMVQIVSTASVLMDFKAGGTAIAFGKVSEKDNSIELDPNWNFYVHGKEILDLLEAKVVYLEQRMQKLYPIGSIFTTTTDDDPADLMGFGKWEKFAAGRVLIGADGKTYKSGFTGGASTHKITVDEMPNHVHPLSSDNSAHSFAWGGKNKTVHIPTNVEAGNGSSNNMNAKQGEWSNTSGTGGGKAMSLMQPYLVVNFWKRTS